MARRDGGRAEIRSDEVRFSTSSGQSCAKNKTKGSISTGGAAASPAGWPLYFWRRVGFWGRRVKKKNKRERETWIEVLRSV